MHCSQQRRSQPYQAFHGGQSSILHRSDRLISQFPFLEDYHKFDHSHKMDLQVGTRTGADVVSRNAQSQDYSSLSVKIFQIAEVLLLGKVLRRVVAPSSMHRVLISCCCNRCTNLNLIFCSSKLPTTQSPWKNFLFAKTIRYAGMPSAAQIALALVVVKSKPADLTIEGTT